ncbi:MAG: Gldg family protein [Lysobacteraceae bacterium]
MSAFDRKTLTGSSLVLIAILFVAAVVLGGTLLRGVRLDLTENRLYTLSDGTRKVVAGLEEPINLYFYFSDSMAQDAPQLRAYANRVRELLEELASVSRGKVALQVIDPLPFSEDEDRASGYGLQGVPVGSGGQNLYFGLAGVNSTDGVALIPFFQQNKEAFLEYDVVKLISSLGEAERPVVGLLSTLEMGPGFDPSLGRVNEGWVLHGELNGLFDVRKLDRSLTRIDDDIQLLMLVHPKDLGADALYAIDQFVLRGGRLLVLVDPHAESEQPGQGEDPMAAAMGSKASDLPQLFAAWGVDFDPGAVVLDAQGALQIQTRADAAPIRHLAIIGLDSAYLNQNDVISAQLGSVNISSAGHFMQREGASTQMEPLAQSSGNAAVVSAERVRFLPDPESLYADFSPTGERYVLAARLTGPVKSAFPEREGEGHLAASAEDVNIVLVADTDIASDRLWVNVQSFFGQRVVNAFAGNGDFLINAVDNLIGSSDLIAVRTRASSQRPFTTVDALRRAADERFRAKEQELQAELSETERKLAELQSARGDQNALVLTPAQQAELQRFQDQKLRIRKDLRQVRRQLDADIQSLQGKLKFLNVAGIPILITLGALGFGLWRLRRRKENGQ